MSPPLPRRHRWTATVFYRSPTTRGAERYVRAAHVILHLHLLCRECNADLAFVIDKKMEINRARKWKLDGHGSHVEGT